MTLLRSLLVFVLIAGPLWAEEVVLGLSKDEVAITATFDGSDILIFGAVKRESPIQSEPPLQVIVAVAGPSSPVTVRRKERRFGIWMNTDSVGIDSAPSFYAVASSIPLQDAISDTEDLRHKITIQRAIKAVGATEDALDAENFRDALVRIRRNSGQYQTLENAVKVDEQTLFRTSISMPSNLTEGDYPTRIFLTRGGEVVSHIQTTIDVRKVGLERWLFTLSRNQPLLYGLMSLAIAIAAGWGASAAFRLLRQS